MMYIMMDDGFFFLLLLPLGQTLLFTKAMLNDRITEKEDFDSRQNHHRSIFNQLVEN